ncbi:MAG: RelA/SpoT family protein [Dehalococcoidia bacterium]
MQTTGAQDVSIAALLEKAGAYLPPAKIPLIKKAYEFAESAHEGQLRATGDPFITHPLEVAILIAGLELDHLALAAALLHDVQEDCGVENAEIVDEFGPEVAHLVEGLTKLDRLQARIGPIGADSRAADQAENIRKMFLAMADDVSVVVIKLCDRLHNMRTLWVFDVPKQRRIARETLDIYAPLASRLGIWEIKWQLEDLAFRYLDPERYKDIAARIASKREVREGFIQEAIKELQAHLDDVGVEAGVEGRAKHIYSIFQKAGRYAAQAKGFDQIYDLLALRVMVGSVEDCYHALGAVHQIWRPVPGQIDDYIANPKESGYQSLHTTVMGPGGRMLEVQIRTQEMHRVAEHGVAAHWRYKERAEGARHEEDRIVWLRQLLEWQREVAGAEEFVEGLKTDVFPEKVFVFTPRGEVIEMPAGATSLDFAYHIHTDLGHQTVGAKVNGRISNLNRPLSNGDVVEIMRSRTSKGPSRDWLNSSLGFVKTAHSRSKIRQWFRRLERVENIERGREMFEKELKRLGVDLDDRLPDVMAMFGFSAADDFYAAVGYGGVSTTSLARKLGAMFEDEEDLSIPEAPSGPQKETLGGPGMRVLGVGNLLTTLARCCNPVPGDEIVGYVTRARGVTVHRADCRNVWNTDERERLVEVEWGASEKLYPAHVRIDAWDRVGLLRDISVVVTEEHVNMVGVRTQETGDGTVQVLATLETTGMEQLSRLLARIAIIRGVRGVERAAESSDFSGQPRTASRGGR